MKTRSRRALEKEIRTGRRIWSRLALATLLVGITVVLGDTSSRAAAPAADAAIQAVQQAPDPSAAITAYANAFAQDRDNPALYDAYVSRMVDLGLPEMAYHQAQTLTTLQSNNGLSWSVVAYVDARRGQMQDALSAINLAGQFAPDNQFVQHTAGELVAWYDLKADKTKLPANVQQGMARLRSTLGERTEYTQAYAAAQKAYQTETGSAAAPVVQQPGLPVTTNPSQAVVVPQPGVDQIAPLGYAPAAAPPADYSDYADYLGYSSIYLDWGPSYCYDWGPGWVAPVPWYWWQPCGFWGGYNFFPFGVSFAFGDFDDFHHHGFSGHGDRFHHGEPFDHGRGFGRGDRFPHAGAFARGSDPARWHNSPQSRGGFFGTPARPSPASAQWARASSQPSAALAASAPSAGTRWWAGAHGALSAPGTGARWSQPALTANRWSPAIAPVAPARSGGLTTGGSWSTGARIPATLRAPATGAWAPAKRLWAGQNYTPRNYAASRNIWAAAPRNSLAMPATPRFSMPATRSFGTRGGWLGGAVTATPRAFGSGLGSLRGGSSFGGGISRGGAMGGGFRGSGGAAIGAGGFHGGGFGGGIHGGHR